MDRQPSQDLSMYFRRVRYQFPPFTLETSTVEALASHPSSWDPLDSFPIAYAGTHHPFLFFIFQGLAGGSLSGKSSLVHRYLAGHCPKDEVLSGRHKKCIMIDGQKYLLLVRDETGPPDAQVCWLVGFIVLVLRNYCGLAAHP